MPEKFTPASMFEMVQRRNHSVDVPAVSPAKEMDAAQVLHLLQTARKNREQAKAVRLAIALPSEARISAGITAIAVTDMLPDGQPRIDRDSGTSAVFYVFFPKSDAQGTGNGEKYIRLKDRAIFRDDAAKIESAVRSADILLEETLNDRLQRLVDNIGLNFFSSRDLARQLNKGSYSGNHDEFEAKAEEIAHRRIVLADRYIQTALQFEDVDSAAYPMFSVTEDGNDPDSIALQVVQLPEINRADRIRYGSTDAAYDYQACQRGHSITLSIQELSQYQLTQADDEQRTPYDIASLVADQDRTSRVYQLPQHVFERNQT